MEILTKIYHSLLEIDSYIVSKLDGSSKEVLFLGCIVVFPILARLLPLSLISLVVIFAFSFYVLRSFLNHVILTADSEQTKLFKNGIEYSWGFVPSDQVFDHNKLLTYLKSKDWNFYKTYILGKKYQVVISLLIFGDLLVAFKNLSLETTGAYFAISLFTKFVFISYLYINRQNRKILKSDLEQNIKESHILDNFYKHFAGIISIFFVIFILFFILGKFVVEIFFGFRFLEYQTSLSFILLANASLVITLVIFRTAVLIDPKSTWRIMKTYTPFLIVLFIFMKISHTDTVAFFVIGASTVLSIFLYNFSIRKPAYIENTYKYLF